MIVSDGVGVSTGKPALYDIRVAGILHGPWCELSEDMELTIVHEDTGPVTVMRVFVPDQAGLAGLLDWIFTLNLTLLSVSMLETR